MTNIIRFQEISMNSLEISNLLTQFNLENDNSEEVRHDSVKRAVDRLVGREVISQPPLVDDHFIDAQGKSRTRKVYLFQGEQGKRDTYVVVAQLSPEFTAVIVDRWQELEGLHKNMSPAEVLLYNAQRLVAQEREQARLAARQTELEKSQYEIKQQVKAIIEGENYYTVVGVCNIYGIKVDKPLSSKIGKEASKICKANNWKIGTAPSVEFGRINSYPKEAIEEAMTMLGLLMDVCEHKSDNRH